MKKKIFNQATCAEYVKNHEVKPVLALSKLIYVGFTVRELSKCSMYDFLYNLIKKF